MNRTWIELDREALAHNIRRYQSLLPAGCRIMGVVKADAYGHGARAVAAQLWELGIRHFATATLDEAVQLREAGIQGEILILGYSAPAYFHLLARADPDRHLPGPRRPDGDLLPGERRAPQGTYRSGHGYAPHRIPAGGPGRHPAGV